MRGRIFAVVAVVFVVGVMMMLMMSHSARGIFAIKKREDDSVEVVGGKVRGVVIFGYLAATKSGEGGKVRARLR